jgi:X-X-X-Leu-X-X-Gly heptad repeat protein
VRHRRLHTRSLAPLAVGLSVWLIWPAQSLAKALVRFIHGVPGVGRATVSIDGRQVGSVAFAQSTSWHSVRSGSFRWTLTNGAKTLASGTSTVGNGAYDIVVLEKASSVWLGIYPAQGGHAGASLIRVIHGAPELGSPELTVDGKNAVKSLAYTQATPYVSLSPGTHRLGAVRPGSSTAVVGATVTLKPGVAYSAVVLGTRGEQVRVVELVDRGAPLARRALPVAAHPAAHGSRPLMLVAPGDSLWTIARRLAGPQASASAIEARVHLLWNLNESRIGTGDPNLIFPGTRLRLQ